LASQGAGLVQRRPAGAVPGFGQRRTSRTHRPVRASVRRWSWWCAR